MVETAVAIKLARPNFCLLNWTSMFVVQVLLIGFYWKYLKDTFSLNG